MLDVGNGRNSPVARDIVSESNISTSPPSKRQRLSSPERTQLEAGQSLAPNDRPSAQSAANSSKVFASPVQLNYIDQLPQRGNVDCLRLGSILGDPVIKEGWLFTFLVDVDFMM